jgi:SAM-dependent methyltransferase
VLGALPYGAVASVDGLAGLNVVDAGPASQEKYRAAQSDGKHAHTKTAPPTLATALPGAVGPFTQFALEQAALRPGKPVTILQAGCTTAGTELDLAALRASGHQAEVLLIDDETPATRAVVAGRPDLESAQLAELRTVPLRPRSFDIVQCSLLLHRISNADMVLGRLTAALRPGGLLLLRLADPGSASGFLDRRLPEFVRAIAWRSSRPGQPGPYPAVYERVASGRGVELFMSRHGLAIAYRAQSSSAASQTRPGAASAAARLVAWLSRGRLPADHDELCYVVRKPEDRFARVLR